MRDGRACKITQRHALREKSRRQSCSTHREKKNPKHERSQGSHKNQSGCAFSLSRKLPNPMGNGSWAVPSQRPSSPCSLLLSALVTLGWLRGFLGAEMALHAQQTPRQKGGCGAGWFGVQTQSPGRNLGRAGVSSATAESWSLPDLIFCRGRSKRDTEKSNCFPPSLLPDPAQNYLSPLQILHPAQPRCNVFLHPVFQGMASNNLAIP